MDPVTALVQCLKYSLCNNDKSIVLESMSFQEFTRLCDLAFKHDVGQIVYFALKKQHMLPKPTNSEEQAYIKKIERRVLSAVVYTENMTHIIHLIDSALSEDHVRHVFLKGAVVRKLYPEAWMRTSGDIDCLVPPEELDAAISALERIGFCSNGKKRYHDIELKKDNVHLELHFNIRENKPDLDQVLKNVWENIIPQDKYLYQETPEFFVFHHMAHMAYHLVCGGFGIKSILDLLIMNLKMHYDANQVHSLCEQAGLATLYETAMALLDVWFNDGNHNNKTIVLQDYIMQSGAFGTQDQVQQAGQLMATAKKEKLWHYIFLPAEEICELYPTVERYPWLLPFYEVRRWIEKVSEKKSRQLLRRVILSRKTEATQIENVFQIIGVSHLIG